MFTLMTGPAVCQQLGINLAGVHDWNSELPFVDFFRLSRSWISQERDKPWGKGPPLELDERGWVKRLSPGTWAETCILNIREGHYPHGTYTLFFDGRGRIDINNVDGVFKQSSGKVEFEVTGDEGIVWIQIKETEPSDYIRNIRVYPPGFTENDGLLRPGFLQRWRGVKAVRFMEFLAVNNSKEQHWHQRARINDATWTVHGAPIEVAVAIANGLHASPWFSIPHKADDDYIRRYAGLVREMLNPELPIYIEYSNETWNPLFSQTQYCREQGLARKLSDNPVQAGHRFSVQRSLEIFRIWEEVFGSRKRLVRVIAGQAANPAVNTERLSFRKAWQECDALAIAPYITLNVSTRSTPPLAQVRNWSIVWLEYKVTGSILSRSIQWMRDGRKTAKRYRVSLIAYEGGQHLVGIQGAENDEQLTSLFLEANRAPWMGSLYDRYLDEWKKISADGLLCHWLSTEIWSKWGSWGLAEYYDEDIRHSPKLKAVLNRVTSAGEMHEKREELP
jgi:hypothetical protein